MRKNYFLLLILLSLISGTLEAQVTPRWTSIFQGTGDNSERYNKIIPDGTGNFIGVGYTYRKGNYRDILVTKFNDSGDTLWWRTKNGSGNGDDEAIAAGVDAGGNVYVAATVDAGNKQDNIMTMKFTSSGDVLWDTTWDSPSSLDDRAVDLKIDYNGNCIVGGNAEPDTVTGSSDFIVLKYAPTGALTWAQQWSRAGVPGGKDELAGVEVDVNNDVYATGRSFGVNDDFMLLKINGITGGLVWPMSYNGSGEDRAVAIGIDNAHFIVIAGSSEVSGNLDYRINKYDTTGVLQWTRSLPAPAGDDERPTALKIDGNDNIYVTGYADVAAGVTRNDDFQTVKYNSAGTLQWVRRDGGPIQQEDQANDLVVDANGNVYVTGKSDQDFSPTFADFDYMTVAYNPSGGILWGPLYHSGSRPGDDDIASSIVLENGNVYVAGGAVNNPTQKDATVVKYGALAGNVVWVKDHNGSGDFSDEARDIVVDANNISYVAGSTFVEDRNFNACIAKVDNAGNILCTYQYSGARHDDDEFKTIALSSSGSIYAAGYTRVVNQKRNMLLVKWNPSTCDTVWTRTYDYVGQSDRVEAMVLDNSGNIYITGRSDASLNDTLSNEDVVTIKYDTNGNVLWLSRFAGGAQMRDEPVVIVIDNAGDIVIGGRTENIHDDDYLVLKYNPIDGQLRSGFPVTYGGPFSNDDRVTDIAIDANNNIFVAGYSQTGSGFATQDPTMIAYDASGNIISSVFFIYSALGQDEIVKIGFDIFGDLFILNKYMEASGTVNNYDFLLRKFHPSMDTVWTRRYDSPIHGNDVPFDMAFTPAGDVYITGRSAHDSLLGAVNQNWVTLGYDTAGNQIFYANANGLNSTDDVPDALVIRGSTIWVCGFTENSNFHQEDLTVISYDIPVTISVPEQLALLNSKAYPNPFSEECRISIESGNSQLNFELYDMLGNKVREIRSINEREFVFNRGDLASGIYQYRIHTEKSLISTGKLIIN